MRPKWKVAVFTVCYFVAVSAWSGTTPSPETDPVAGGPYDIYFGEDLMLDGSESSCDYCQLERWEWDISGDGLADLEGVIILVPWSTLDSLLPGGAAPGTYDIDLIYTVNGINENEGDQFQSIASALLTIDAAVPIPAAAWLFGTGLLGLVGVARRRHQSKA